MFDSVGSGDLTLISGDMYSCEVPDIPQFTQGMEGWSLYQTACCVSVPLGAYMSMLQ